MRIVSWNCHCGFTKEKAAALLNILQTSNEVPDILIVQECKQVDCVNLNWKNTAWFGDGKDSNLGICLFSKNYSFERILEHNVSFRYVVPYRVSEGKNVFTLFAVWTKEIYCDYPYIGQVYEAINYPTYAPLLDKPVVIIGDFNANQCWDNECIQLHRPTYSNVVSCLAEKHIQSVYHQKHPCEHGQELHKTHFNDRQQKFYHIDYCFASESMNPKNIAIADESEWENTKNSQRWRGLSDHCPIVVDFDW